MTSSLLSLTQNLFIYMLIFSVQLLLILALRKPVRKWLGARVAYLLWLLPVLWVPFFVAGEWLGKLSGSWADAAGALFSQSETAQVAGAQLTTSVLPEAGQVLPSAVFQQYITPVLNGTIATDGPARFVWQGLTVMWVAGMLFLLVWQAGRLLKFRHLLKTEGVQTRTPAELKLKVHCLTLGAMDGPAVFGFLKPVLLLPEHFESAFDPDQRHLVLAHEAVHLRRHDNLWNLLAEGFRLLFWLNPLVHIAYHKYRLDQELSCDAAALEICSPTQQHRFARTLLKTTEPGRFSTPFALTAWDNLNELKERSLMIKHHIKQKRRPAITTLLLGLLVLSGATGTAVVANNQANIPAPEGTLSSAVAELVNEVESTLSIPASEASKSETIPRAREAIDALFDLADERSFNDFELYTMWMLEASVTGEDKVTRLGAWWPSGLSGFELTIEQTSVANEAEYTELAQAQVNAYNSALQYAANEEQKLAVYYQLSQLYMSGPFENQETELDYLHRVYNLQPDYRNTASRITLIYSSNDLLQEALPFAEEAVLNARKLAANPDFMKGDESTYEFQAERSKVSTPFLMLSLLYYRMGYEEEAQEVNDELDVLMGRHETQIMEL